MGFFFHTLTKEWSMCLPRDSISWTQAGMGTLSWLKDTDGFIGSSLHFTTEMNVFQEPTLFIFLNLGYGHAQTKPAFILFNKTKQKSCWRKSYFGEVTAINLMLSFPLRRPTHSHLPSSYFPSSSSIPHLLLAKRLYLAVFFYYATGMNRM